MGNASGMEGLKDFIQLYAKIICHDKSNTAVMAPPVRVLLIAGV
jgi:hypothetical protein